MFDDSQKVFAAACAIAFESVSAAIKRFSEKFPVVPAPHHEQVKR